MVANLLNISRLCSFMSFPESCVSFVSCVLCVFCASCSLIFDLGVPMLIWGCRCPCLRGCGWGKRMDCGDDWLPNGQLKRSRTESNVLGGVSCPGEACLPTPLSWKDLAAGWSRRQCIRLGCPPSKSMSGSPAMDLN